MKIGFVLKSMISLLKTIIWGYGMSFCTEKLTILASDVLLVYSVLSNKSTWAIYHHLVP